MIDLTWGGWIKGKRAAIEMGLPYIRVQGAENHPFVQAADDFLESQVSCAKSIAIFQIVFCINNPNSHYAKSNNINLFLFMN